MTRNTRNLIQGLRTGKARARAPLIARLDPLVQASMYRKERATRAGADKAVMSPAGVIVYNHIDGSRLRQGATGYQSGALSLLRTWMVQFATLWRLHFLTRWEPSGASVRPS